MEQQRKSITSLLPHQLQDVVTQLGQPAFRAGQVFDWLHNKRVTEFTQMTNLPALLRQQLAAEWEIDAPVVKQKQVSQDGTVKYLLELADGNLIEAVLMRYHKSTSLCISSQVGCRMGCKFCASTQGGLVRSLTAGEIAAEVYTVLRDAGISISHIVMMGIGEPLDNFDNVVDFLTLITHEKGLNLSMRNISVSTCGLVPAIQKLAEKHLGLTLSVSLHAGYDEVRSGMMPVNNRWPVEELVAACRNYQRDTGRRISFEYAMVQGINDSEADAKQLAHLLKGMGAHINLIPINPVDGSPYSTSDKERIVAFQKKLQGLGLNATIRRRLGSDISAACGQLRRQAARGEQNES